MYIKSSLFFAVVLFFAASSLSEFCSAQKSNPNPNPTQLKSRTRPVIPFRHVTLAAPPGMVYIPGGSVTIKYSQSSSDTNSKKRVSLTSFYIDKTEVTNQQYRLFTEWVIDSIAVKCYLKDEKYFYPLPENNSTADASQKSIETVIADTTKHDSLNFIQKDKEVAAAAPAPVKDTTSFANRHINWSKVNHKEIFESNDEGIRSKIQPMLDAEGKIRQDLYVYTYYYARALGTNPKAKVGDITSQTLNIYPDERIWVRDLTNAQVDILVENYFSTPPFDDYPVVGVTWQQARAFAYWRSKASANYEWIADYLKYYRLNYNLPSEAQWVYAAGGDMKKGQDNNNESTELPAISDSVAATHDSTMHDSTSVQMAQVDKPAEAPVDKEYSGIDRDKDGKLLENFKQDEGRYNEDGGTFTLPVMSYSPNEFGIYNMVGNVAEWVLDAYSPSAFAFISDVNPVLLYDADSTEAEAMKRKVVRGGSFMSNARALSPYTRDEELQDKSHCYIGFRCILPAPEILNKAVATRRKNTGSYKKQSK